MKAVNNDWATHCTLLPSDTRAHEALQQKLIASSKKGQSCDSIAHHILSIAKDPSPKLHHQTSEQVKISLVGKLNDMDGEIYRK